MPRHFASTLLAIGLGTVALAAGESSYVGQEKRAIKALSEQEIADYLKGAGRGSSKAAELNHYPGPRHVLDAAQGLALTPEKQISHTGIDGGNAFARHPPGSANRGKGGPNWIRCSPAPPPTGTGYAFWQRSFP